MAKNTKNTKNKFLQTTVTENTYNKILEISKSNKKSVSALLRSAIMLYLHRKKGQPDRKGANEIG